MHEICTVLKVFVICCSKNKKLMDYNIWVEVIAVAKVFCPVSHLNCAVEDVLSKVYTAGNTSRSRKQQKKRYFSLCFVTRSSTKSPELFIIFFWHDQCLR